MSTSGSRIDQLAKRFRDGDEGALAKAITIVERGGSPARAFLTAIRDRAGHAQVCGITGPPGTGKSSLTLELSIAIRQSGRRVAVLAIDPSSPFTGGALLGDRVRMGAVAADEGVYIRSLATRGSHGALSRASRPVIRVLEAFGFDVVILETVGAGQSEVAVMRQVHSVVVVGVPGLGDGVQAMKAGLMEIGDIFVVNKADLPEADRTAAEISALLDLSHMGHPGINLWQDKEAAHADRSVSDFRIARFGSTQPGSVSWRPPVVKTSAVKVEGIGNLLSYLYSHGDFLRRIGGWEERRRLDARHALADSLAAAATERLLDVADRAEQLNSLIEAISTGEEDPDSAAEYVLSLGMCKTE